MRKFSSEQLESAVASSRSIRQVLLALGIRAEGGNYRTIRREIQKLGLDTTHFSGKGWRKGETTPVTPPRRLDEILVENSTATTSDVRRRLLAAGLVEQRCQECHITDWLGKPLTIELDHVNGVHDDHRLENLRMLCPNCHSQTSTYRGRNKRQKRPAIPIQLGMF